MSMIFGSSEKLEKKRKKSSAKSGRIQWIDEKQQNGERKTNMLWIEFFLLKISIFIARHTFCQRNDHKSQSLRLLLYAFACHWNVLCADLFMVFFFLSIFVPLFRCAIHREHIRSDGIDWKSHTARALVDCWWIYGYMRHISFGLNIFALSKQSACRLWNQWIKLMRRRHTTAKIWIECLTCSLNTQLLLHRLILRGIFLRRAAVVNRFLWAPGSCDQSTDALHTFFRCINYTNLNRKKGTVERMVRIAQLPLRSTTSLSPHHRYLRRRRCHTQNSF